MKLGLQAGAREPVFKGVDGDTLLVRHLRFEPMEDGAVAQLARLLDDSERAHAATLRHGPDRHAYVMAHALTRATLSSAFDLAPQHWRFAPGRHGKPHVVGPEAARSLSFNLSHARGMVAVALSCDRDVGVDVELIEPGKLTLQLADQMYAPSERALCHAAPEAQLTDALYDIWTLKEAYIKADGGGFTIPLETFAFTLEPLRISFAPSRGDDAARWLFGKLRPGASHALAFAMRHPRPEDVRVQLQRVLVDDLLRISA